MNPWNPNNGGSCKCGQKWFGTNAAHCTVCHNTFGSSQYFDQHRKNEQCIHPSKLKLVSMIDNTGAPVWRKIREQ